MPTDPSFRMTVFDVSPLPERGMIATGKIESGTLTVGDSILISRPGSAILTVVIAIDAFQKQLQQAQKGETVGAVLHGIATTDIQRGDVLLGFESKQSRASWDERDKPLTTYRNEEYGFEIDLPSGWGTTSGISRIPVILSNVIKQANILEEFSFGNNEFLNIVVERMQPEIPPDINELVFTLNALEMKYTDLKFGRITVGGREHAWACYVMNRKGWLKKYMIVLNGYGYALTASCPRAHRNLTMEGTWDNIATSLRLLKPIDSSLITLNNSPQVKRSIEMLRQELKRQLEARQQ